MLNKDYKEMLECLSEEKVSFLLTRVTGVEFERAYANRGTSAGAIAAQEPGIDGAACSGA
jgi:hypothetical protein